MDVAILGCGYIGQKLAHALRRDGSSVQCFTASQASADDLTAQGLDVAVCDLDSNDLSIHLGQTETLYYLAPPPSTGQLDSRSRAAVAAIEGDGLKRVVLISTTGVYGDCGGDWVDEARPLNPSVDRARRRVDSESVWQAWAHEQNVEISILRVAGIYAADRLPRKRLESGEPVLALDESPFSNRVHADDLVQICMAAARSKSTGVFNVADDAPTTMSDYFMRVADALGLVRPIEISRAQAEQRFSDRMMSYLSESRRIDNGKLKRDLGVTLQYPNLDSGLNAVSKSQCR
ncbi:MAG: SDR family oxidoreductase [Pseudomonadota bacterium]